MASIPGNMFDDSVPLRPGHLPGISTLDPNKVHYRFNTGRRSSSEDQGWKVVQGKASRGWKGSSEKRNIILL